MYAEFLRKISIFKPLPDHIIEILSAKIKTAQYQKGDFVFHESDEAKAVFFVKSGAVKIKKINAQGKELIVCMKRSGDIFAEASLFCESGSIYPGTAQMLSSGEVLYLLTTDLEEALSMNPELSVEMIRFMSTQLRSFTSILRDIALLDVYGKTVKTIERLAREFGSKTESGVVIELPLSIQELANIVGSTRESVSRVLSKLREQDLISINEKNIIINNWCDFCHMFAETVEA
ncbi:Crp/Fnr family transcriptional regulator [Calidifontibacillus oryziterrae]|uniref:Crp/Fnr family transcriptional regulator n=1 Tax=Calidifontibacillus oryziterrae TaxID=1191699 RepID=UPI000301D3BE|nr:Crp/Fnr family transcriptional regulator [Calidifontibacillus oryziterrae]